MVTRSFAYRKRIEHVLDHCSFLIEITRFFTNVMPLSKLPQRPQERDFCLGPRVFIIPHHRKSIPGCLSLEMDRSDSKHVKLWWTWDNKSKSPSVWMLLFGASNQIRSHTQGCSSSETMAYQPDEFWNTDIQRPLTKVSHWFRMPLPVSNLKYRADDSIS